MAGLFFFFGFKALEALKTSEAFESFSKILKLFQDVEAFESCRGFLDLFLSYQAVELSSHRTHQSFGAYENLFSLPVNSSHTNDKFFSIFHSKFVVSVIMNTKVLEFLEKF